MCCCNPDPCPLALVSLHIVWEVNRIFSAASHTVEGANHTSWVVKLSSAVVAAAAGANGVALLHMPVAVDLCNHLWVGHGPRIARMAAGLVAPAVESGRICDEEGR